MGKAIPTQHPAVVLRSHFKLVRALLAVAMIAVVGLTIAVVIVARDDDPVAGTSSAGPVESIRYGGFNPATGRPDSAPLAQREHPLQNSIGSTRYDGGPEEGTRGTVAVQPPNSRYDGSPEEGTRGPVKDYSKNAATGDHARAPAQSPDTRYDGGPEEGSRGSSR